MNNGTIEWTQPYIGQDPEFYEIGEVAVININGRSISVHRDGLALAFYDSLAAFSDVVVIRTAAEFREAFPEGCLPTDGTLDLQVGAFFELYEGDKTVGGGGIMDSFDHAFEEALEIVARSSLGMS